MRISKDNDETTIFKMLNAFPGSLNGDVTVVLNYLEEKNYSVHPTVYHEVVLDGCKLIIPGRVYTENNSVISVSNLTDIQQTIFHCICLRHNNGFIRQKALEQLNNNSEFFIIPFVFQLLGEYVIEIVRVINDQTNQLWLRHFALFANENLTYWMQTESRMISYWNEYYRWPNYPKIKNYVGYEIMGRIRIEHEQLMIANTSSR